MGIIALVKRQICLRVAQRVAKHFIAPTHISPDSLCVWIENNFVRVETMSIAWLIGTAYPIAVQLPRAGIGQITMPDEISSLGDRNPRGFFAIVRRIK